MIKNPAIEKKLQALAADHVQIRDGARRISNGFVPQPLYAVLQELDATVLGRRLKFTSSKGHLSVNISGRRIQGISEVSDNFKAARDLVGQSVSPDDEEVVAALADVFKQFAAPEEAISVQSVLPDPAGRGLGAGLSVLALAKAMDVELYADLPEPLQLWFDDISELCSAALLFDEGEEAASFGEEDQLSALYDFVGVQWEDFLESYMAGHADGDSDPVLLFLDGGNLGSVIVSEAGEKIVVLSCGAQNNLSIYASWQKFLQHG